MNTDVWIHVCGRLYFPKMSLTRPWPARTLSLPHQEAASTSVSLDQYGSPPMRKVRRTLCDFWGLVITFPWTSTLLFGKSSAVCFEETQVVYGEACSLATACQWCECTILKVESPATDQGIPWRAEISCLAKACPSCTFVSKIHECGCKPLGFEVVVTQQQTSSWNSVTLTNSHPQEDTDCSNVLQRNPVLCQAGSWEHLQTRRNVNGITQLLPRRGPPGPALIKR